MLKTNLPYVILKQSLKQIHCESELLLQAIIHWLCTVVEHQFIIKHYEPGKYSLEKTVNNYQQQQNHKYSHSYKPAI